TSRAHLVGRVRLIRGLASLGAEPSCRPGAVTAGLACGMSLEELIIAHAVVARLLPDELAELEDQLGRGPLPAPAGCGVPLADLKRLVAAEFGEECHAVRQLDSLIL